MSLIHTADADGKNQTPVSSANPLPAIARQTVRVANIYSEATKPSGSFILPSSAANTNAQTIASGQRDLHFIAGINTVASIRYLKLYNKATTPLPASDTPVLLLALPASKEFQFQIPGFYFPLGIGIVLVTGAAHTDTTAGALGDITGLCISYGSFT